MRYFWVLVMSFALFASAAMAQEPEIFLGTGNEIDLPKQAPENYLAKCLANPDDQISCHLAKTTKNDGGLESAVAGQLDVSSLVTCNNEGGVCLELATFDLSEEDTQQAPKERLPSVDITIQFDYDKAEIRTEEEAKLAQLATALKHSANAEATFAIIGHTDAKGTSAYNCSLSTRRASAVSARLASIGISSDRLVTIGAGEYVLRDPQNDGAAENRRVGFARLAENEGVVIKRLSKLCASK